MWESVLVEWEGCNILDGSGDVFILPLKLIRKSTFGSLANLKEKKLEKLARGLFDHTIMLWECLAKGGGRPNLKLMYKITRVLKQKMMIRNEIMLHFIFSKLTSNNQKPCKDDKWKEVKTKHSLTKMFFSILGLEFNKASTIKKMRLNPLDEVSPTRFKHALQKWIESGTLEGNVVEAILLDSHYKFERINNMAGLLDVIDKEEMASILHDNATRIITVVCTTHMIKDNPTMWIGPDWESFL